MIVQIPNVLTKDEVLLVRKRIAKLEWIDGRVSAGHQSGKVKSNLQLQDDDPDVKSLSSLVISVLEKNPAFIASALPLKVFPPSFNKYENNGYYGSHVDNSIRMVKGTPERVRTDISATLFLSEPHEYEGGELIIEDSNANYSIKLEAGSLVLYESGQMHNVNPVLKGSRLACFFWIQSMVRSCEQRKILFELDNAIQKVSGLTDDHKTHVQLTGVYHNLLRMWSDC